MAFESSSATKNPFTFKYNPAACGNGLRDRNGEQEIQPTANERKAADNGDDLPQSSIFHGSSKANPAIDVDDDDDLRTGRALERTLLLSEVFKVKSQDPDGYDCQGFDAQGARCSSRSNWITSVNADMIAWIEIRGEIDTKTLDFLAKCNLCLAHKTQSTTLTKEWVRLFKLTRPTRAYWKQEQISSYQKVQARSEMYAQFASAEIRRILEMDRAMTQAEKVMVRRDDESQNIVQQLHQDVSALNSKVSDLTSENLSLEDAQREIKEAFEQEEEWYQTRLRVTKELYQMSQKTVEGLYTEISNLTDEVAELTTKNSHLEEKLDAIGKARLEENNRNERDLNNARELYQGSQSLVEMLRTDVSDFSRKIDEMAAENSSLREGQNAIQEALNWEKEFSQRDVQEITEMYNIAQRTIDVFHKEKYEAAKRDPVKEIERIQQDLKDARDLYEASQRTIDVSREDISALNSKVSKLRIENSSLKEEQETAKHDISKEKKRSKDAKILYEKSQRTIEALRKDLDALNFCLGEITTEGSARNDSLVSIEDALKKEKARSRELEIRLEERMALGVKLQDPEESKLEKYLREELEKSHRQVLQLQKDLEKLRDDLTGLRIAKATLESQTKQMEQAKEETKRASEKQFQELAERNSDLSNQLHHTKTKFGQLQAEMAAMEKTKEIDGEVPKSKFSLKDLYRRPKPETSKSTDGQSATNS